MKIGGVKVTRCEEILVLPRTGDNLIFIAHAVASMDEFDAMCPQPEATSRIVPGKGTVTHETEGFLKELRAYNEKRHAYICIKTLEPSNIDWDNVDLEKPETWAAWMEELESAGLADIELQRVQVLVLEANALSESKLKEARDSFLLGREDA